MSGILQGFCGIVGAVCPFFRAGAMLTASTA